MAPKIVKREPAARNGPEDGAESSRQDVAERRVLRSRYLAVKNLISGEKEDIARHDSDKFQSIITEVESLHQLVQKPREQVADAEALLDIANTLVTSVKSQANEGVTPADFVTALLMKSSQEDRGINAGTAPNMAFWSDLGLAVSRIFRKGFGCQTMVGPMNTEMKQRKLVVRAKRTKPAESTRPEELVDTEAELKTDTDKNMSIMFDILRKKRKVGLENLVLNPVSFAQTVENIFALSFLVKDGRVEITINDSGHHIVSPRNAPAASAVTSGEVCYNHFVFRYDFQDWKVMRDSVGAGEELMPHRCGQDQSKIDQTDRNSRSASQTTPIRKFSRNRGLVIQEQAVIADSSPEKDDSSPMTRKGKRRLFD